MNHAFLARLDELLLPHGFTRAGPAVYRRDWRGGFDAIVPMTVHYPGEIKLDFSLNIRHDAVELLLARADPVTSGSGPHSPTTITHLGDMKRQGAVGDVVIIISYARMNFEEAKKFQPWVIFPKEGNLL